MTKRERILAVLLSRQYEHLTTINPLDPKKAKAMEAQRHTIKNLHKRIKKLKKRHAKKTTKATKKNIQIEIDAPGFARKQYTGRGDFGPGDPLRSGAS